MKGDHVAAAQELQKRVTLILHVNPWLGPSARLPTGWRPTGNYLEYEDFQNDTDVSQVFQHIVDPPNNSPRLCQNTPIEELGDATCKYRLSAEDKLLFRVVVVPCHANPKEYFGIIVSMSHVVADGHTYYRIYDMLLSSSLIENLVVQRISTSEKQLVEELGNAAPAYRKLFWTYPSFLLSMLFGYIRYKLQGQSRDWRSLYFTLDKTKIEILKKKHQSSATKDNKEVPFISFPLRNAHLA